MTQQEPIPEIPVFSPRLDEVLGMMIKGEAPNAGRFCSHCYTPIGKSAAACPYCGRDTETHMPLGKVPSEVIALYKRMRKRESLIVNSFAFGGLFLGVLIFMILVAVAVYLLEAAIWMLVLATVALLIGGRVLAGIFGGWIGDNIGYDYAHRKLVLEWQEFERQRSGTTPSPHDAAPATR
jgi:hypothetical protein